ncbi:HU family DNA-binding protein [Mycoplasmatota bacterium WC44]
MPKKVTKSTKKKTKLKSVNQLDIEREIVKMTRGFTLKEISEILDAEKKVIKSVINKKKKVVMKGYMTLSPTLLPERKFKSALDGKVRVIPPTVRISVRIGKGFKDYVNSTKR